MNEIPLHIALIGLALVAACVCVAVIRSIIRELRGMGDDAEFHAARRMEEREALKVLKKWRDGK